MTTQAAKYFSFAFFLYMFALCFPIEGIANSPFGTIHRELEKSMESFHFDAAEKLIPSLEKQPLQTYYSNNILIYKYLSTQSPKYYKEIEAVWDKSISDIETMDQGDTLREILLSDLYGKRSVIAFLNQRYFQAVRYARSAHKMIALSEEKYGDHVEQMKIRGLFNALLGAIPRKFQWISNTLGYKGDIQVARQQLETAVRKSQILGQEAMYILSYVEKGMLNEKENSLARIEKARKASGPNILIDFVLASAYINVKQNDKALEILGERSKYVNSGVFFIPYWDYLMGKSNYYKESYPVAQVYFSQFLNGYEGKLFKSDAYFRLAMSLTLDGSYEPARDFFYKIMDGENEGLDEDEYAIFMAEKFYHQKPNTYICTLFRSRNLFDGGYLAPAKSLLLELKNQHYNSLSLEERTELYYRFGRIYDTERNYPLALENYGKCMAEDESDQTWQQAYSAYYSGEIMKNKGKYDRAIGYYKKALGYKQYFYQTGLENRSKIALGEAKKKGKTQASASSR